MHAEQLTPAVTEHGEGPTWDARSQSLLYVDLLRGDVLTLDGGANDLPVRRNVGDVVACVRARALGGIVAATRNSIVEFDDRSELPVRQTVVFDDPEVRFNEGACDPDGNFYCGTMDWEGRTGLGRMYRYTPGGVAGVVGNALTVPNGLAFRADRGAWFVDSADRRIDRVELRDDGGFVRTGFVTIPTEHGTPDGLCLDSEGGVWVAMWGGSAVRRYDTAGRLDFVVCLPVAQVTACTFGGPDLATMFITTSRYRNADPEPSAGAVFSADTGFHGQPDYSYGKG